MLTNLIEKLLDKKLNPILETVDEVKNKMATIDKIEQSLSFLSDKYDDLLPKVLAMEDFNNELAKENKFLKESLLSSTNNIELMKQDLNNLEQYSRGECLEIRGIPVLPGEKTNEIVRKVGEVIGVAIESNDISISHRLPANRNNSRNTEPAIIAKFIRRDIRDQLYKARKNLRQITTRDIGILRTAERKIYIAESLTQANKKLFNKCLEFKKQQHYKFMCTVYGKIFLRKDESSPSIGITHIRDIPMAG